MALSAKAGFKGLVTACGEVTADAGALRTADNVTLRKEGALTLRSTFGSTALSRTYKAAFPYKGALYYIGGSNLFYDSTQTLMTFGTTSTVAVRDDVQSAKEARGNLYFASATGAWKVSGIGSALERSGMLAGEAMVFVTGVITTGTPLPLANNYYVAYRVVAKRTDVNGVVIRSRPSGAVLVSNTGGSAAAPFVRLAIRQAATVDEVELYRTRTFPIGTQYDDEMQLVATIPSSQFSASPRYYDITDRVADAGRGTTLYTSPSRGGIENANDRPPGAACVERFRGSLFFGNTRGPFRAVVSYKFGNSANGDISGSATGVGSRTTTGNTTNGSGSITSVANTAGLQVGQSVSGTGVNGYVTAIAGSTVTVSPANTATGTGVTLRFQDVIAYSLNGGTVSRNVVASYPYTTTATSLNINANGVVTAYEVTPPQAGYDVTLVFESVDRGVAGASLTLAASHGDEYMPSLPLVSGTFQPLAYESIPNGLAWSEPDEPEHVPTKNFARVGDAGKAILALVATKDRLLIWKEDGLFMLTGDTAKNFSIYPLDTTCLCVLPGSVQRVQNTVYALTNLGLVAIDEAGSVNIVSRSVQNEIAPIITSIRQAQKTSGLYNMPGLSGVTGTADDANGEYWLMLGTTTPSFGGQVLVYNAFQAGFTTYSFGTPTPVAVARDGEGLPLVLTASSLLTPSTALGAITARISPRAFSDPALTQKLWTHVVAGFSKLTGTASVTAKFSGSVSMVAGAEVSEALDIPLESGTGLVQLPLGSLIKHPVPSALRRAYLSFVELVVAVTSGTFTLDVMGMESRENIPNKEPTHGSGAG